MNTPALAVLSKFRECALVSLIKQITMEDSYGPRRV